MSLFYFYSSTLFCCALFCFSMFYSILLDSVLIYSLLLSSVLLELCFFVSLDFPSCGFKCSVLQDLALVSLCTDYRSCRENAASCLSFLRLPPPPPPLEALPSHPLSALIRDSPPHLLLHSIPLLSTGICLGISRWKLYSISGAPYQHTIIMGNHAEQCRIQLGLPL